MHGPVQVIRLDERGLARFFGELEARIMDTVWSLEEATVHDLCHSLGGNCHYKTIMTVANRLVGKGALKRRRQGRAFVYSPAVQRDELLAHVSGEMVAGMMNDFGAAAVAGFVRAVGQVAPEQLQALRRLLEEKIEEQEEREGEPGIGE